MRSTVATLRTFAGYLAGIVIGTMSITLLFLGMRAVMDVGGACADGGPYVSAQPCPSGVPLAMIGGMFGLFAATGLIVWFGTRIGGRYAAIVALGWPALFLSLGFNFLDYGLHPPDDSAAPALGWLIPGVLFWVMGGIPVTLGIIGWREARAGRPVGGLAGQVPRRLRLGAAAGERTPLATASASPGPTADAAVVADLDRLATLHAAGELNDEEFAVAKRARLGERGRDR